VFAPDLQDDSAVLESRESGGSMGADAGHESKTMPLRERRKPRPRQLDAGPFSADVASFRLHLAAEGKSPKTIKVYTEAVRYFAAAHLLTQAGKTRWEQVVAEDVQRWTVWLLAEYSQASAYIEYRALRQFFRWWSAEEELPDPMASLRGPKVTDKPVPFFTSVELSALEKACRGNTFAQRRDAAIIAVFRASGIRLSELAGIRCGDLDLETREIKVLGKGRKERTIKIDYEAARRVDRYLRVRAKHEQASRSWLWLGAGDRGPVSAAGIYEMVKLRGKQAGVHVYPHRFRHHFSHTWLDRGGPEGDLMELNGWVSPQMLTRYGASARAARARRTYDRIMNGEP
jgi:site-specific recombinase XerD